MTDPNIVAEPPGRAPSRPGLTEPVTTATDALVAVTCLALAVDLARRPAPSARPGAYRLWTLALFASAAAAAAGAVSHGTKSVADGTWSRASWTVALRSSGLSGLFLSAGAAMHRPGNRRGLLALASRQAAFQGKITARSPFRSTVVAYGMDSAATVRALTPAAHSGNPSAVLALGSVALTAVGGVVQQAGWGRGRAFNHNDRFHLLQLGSCCLLYAAARRLGEADAGAEADPNAGLTSDAPPPP